MELEDDYRSGPDIEPDSDVEDGESESQLSQWLGELENYAKGLEPGDTGTVKRRQKTVVTAKMAMESFRYSFMSENQDVNFDAILGELCDLETQLGTAQSELPGYGPRAHSLKPDTSGTDNNEPDLAQAELDALANEISCSLGGLKHSQHQHRMGDLRYFRTHYPGDLGGYSDAMLDIAETDSAFSESASLPSSESFTSMVTVSSTAPDAGCFGDTSSIGSGATITGHALQCDSASCPCMRFANLSANQNRPDMISTNQLYRHDMQPANHISHQEACMTNHHSRQEMISTNQRACNNNGWPINGQHSHNVQASIPHVHEEHRAKIKAEKIRIALEKIKEAKIKKLFVRAFAVDGSSKSIMVDEKMTILEVITLLADKNHERLSPDLAVIEHMPELYMERILEDHDSLVENMAMWTRDTKNQILFQPRPQKNDLFKCPERYLLVSSCSERGASLDPKRRDNLIQEFFSCGVSKVPEVEGVLYLKAEGKKAWKKYFFVLRASGLYYNPKGKISKSPKDLTCLVQFEFVDLYIGIHWKKKYHAPTDFCFALKHPQIQKKASKFIRYLCCENKAALDQWIMGIRIAKFGKQLLTNYLNLQREILTWDTCDVHHPVADQSDVIEAVADLNQSGDLTDSRMSMLAPGSRHSIVNVRNPMLVRDPSHSSHGGSSTDDIVCLEIDNSSVESKTPERQLSFHGSASSSGADISDPVRIERGPVKRVSFSTTHSVICDSGAEVLPVRHRDSITSASTDSSEDSTSSGEGRLSGMAHRSSKLRAKLPVTTGTTKHLSEMVQTSLDGSTGSMDSSGEEWRTCQNNNNQSQLQKELAERRKSAPVCSDMYGNPKSDVYSKDQRSMSQTQCHYDPMSPSSPAPNSPFQYNNKGPRGVMSPTPQKGSKSHSRGSSISSVESSDSYQGYLASPTSEYPPHSEQGQSSWIQYDESLGNFPLPKGQAHLAGMVKQGPPTAQKPGSIKKTRPHSGPATGPVEKGHKRNTSKSSLESVEEKNEGQGQSPMHHRGIPSISSPIPARSVASPAPLGHSSQPLTRSLTHTAPPVVRPTPNPAQAPPCSHPPVSYGLQCPTYTSSHPTTPTTPTSSTGSIGSGHPLAHAMGHSPVPTSARGQPSSAPQSPAASSPGCMSPRLSSHRVIGPKPVGPPMVPILPPTPPALVPPAPHSSKPSVNTHKKRPSGGNIKVNGNDAASLQQSGICPDIVSSLKYSQANTPHDGNSQGLQSQNSQAEDHPYEQLPFMAELNKKHIHNQPAHIYDHIPAVSQSSDNAKIPPQTLPKPTDQRGNAPTVCNKDLPPYQMGGGENGHSLESGNQSASSSSSSLSSLGSQHHQQASMRRHQPPAPPRRSESTRLSHNPMAGHFNHQTPDTSAVVPNNSANSLNSDEQSVSENIEPIYDNCEGIMDLNDLPPPPPELLEDFQGQGHMSQESEGHPGVKVKPPPPPPKRNKDTHLSTA